MESMLKKAHTSLYKLLKEGGRQSQLHDTAEYIIAGVICLNVVLIVVESGNLHEQYHGIILALRQAFFVFFLAEYILRLWIADSVMHDESHPVKSRLRYMFSLRALIDLFALFPVMLGSTIIDFRVFRVLRLLKVTQLKGLQQYTNILKKVIKSKGAQLLSSLFIVVIFMLVSAVVIYDLEHISQPMVFENVLSGFWWSISTITTVGYGDIYPITPAGKIFGSVISIFGIFLMALPIGILTSGFFEFSKNNK